MPVTGVLTRPSGMFPKFPTAAAPERAGWPTLFVIVVSVHVVPVRQMAGPSVVVLVTLRLSAAPVIDCPAASVGTVNRRYEVARVAALPSMAWLSTLRLVAVP